MTAADIADRADDSACEGAWKAYLSEVSAIPQTSGIDYANLSSARNILQSMDRDAKARMLIVGVRRLHALQSDLAQRQAQIGKDSDWKSAHALQALLETFLNQPFRLLADELDDLLRHAQDKSDWSQLVPIDGI